MLIDTHCHINMMIKEKFDHLLTPQELLQVKNIIQTAAHHGVHYIINVGTSLIESQNCIKLAQENDAIYATVGIHPNDCTDLWKKDITEIKKLLSHKKKYKIVGIGEVGLDMHYPDYNIARQQDAFKAQINLALEHDLALVVHTRDAADETLTVLEEYKNNISRGIIHCFSENLSFAQQVIAWGFVIGIGGAVTYPKNNTLRTVVSSVSTESLVLETDAPFLPIQSMRGKMNSPANILDIAQYIAQLKNLPLEKIAHDTTKNAVRIFDLPAI